MRTGCGPGEKVQHETHARIPDDEVWEKLNHNLKRATLELAMGDYNENMAFISRSLQYAADAAAILAMRMERDGK